MLITMSDIIQLSPTDLPYINRRELGHHHSLYNHIAKMFPLTYILDIGTRNGVSAWALTHNTNCLCQSVDIKVWKHRMNTPHVEYVNMDCKDIQSSTLAMATIILFDTTHNGVDEQIFYDRLVKMRWDGLLLLDDIHLMKYGDMESFWQGIKLPKYDLTQWGHKTGTGLVDFEMEVELVR